MANDKEKEPKKKELSTSELIDALNQEHQLTELQKAAVDNRRVYQAHIDAGFTTKQSMQILLLLISMSGEN